MAVTGSCLCGKNTFTLGGALTSPRYCHCENCRKFSGTSPASWVMAEAGELVLIRNDAEISEFNSGKGIRCFCASCGSPLWFKSQDYAEVIALPMGVVDEGKLPAPEQHLWVGSKPSWCSVNDTLPKCEGNPPETDVQT